MTLTESLQTGVVPVAFDSYAALHDIITDGYNGFTVPYGDVKTFVRRVRELMDDDGLRLQMARNAIESSARFSAAAIVSKWLALFEESVGDR